MFIANVNKKTFPGWAESECASSKLLRNECVSINETPYRRGWLSVILEIQLDFCDLNGMVLQLSLCPHLPEAC